MNKTLNSSRQIPHHRIDDEDSIFKKYDLGKKLGQGSFGVVHEVTNKETDQKYAIKIINKEKAGKAAFSFENEVFIMKSVTHSSLIKLEEVFESKKKLYIITELCEAGELAKWLKKHGPLKEEKCKIIMRKIVDAISYLHKHDIVHRDLKLENILIKDSCDDVENLDIKITDFGLSSQRETVGTDSLFEGYCGTPLYMAPEIIDNFPYSQLCDVWALGIIMFIILTSQLPFNADTETKLREQIRKAELNTNTPLYMKLSPEAKDCLNRMFKVNPAYRITSRELFSHPWFLDKKMSEVPEQQKNVLELMSEMLKEQEEKSPLNNSAIPNNHHHHHNDHILTPSSSSSLSSNNDGQYHSESRNQFTNTNHNNNNSNNNKAKKPSVVNSKPHTISTHTSISNNNHVNHHINQPHHHHQQHYLHVNNNHNNTNHHQNHHHYNYQSPATPSNLNKTHLKTDTTNTPIINKVQTIEIDNYNNNNKDLRLPYLKYKNQKSENNLTNQTMSLLFREDAVSSTNEITVKIKPVKQHVHELKFQHINRKNFFNASLYHLLKNKKIRANQLNNVQSDENLERFTTNNKVRVIFSPSPSSTSTASSKFAFNRQRKLTQNLSDTPTILETMTTKTSAKTKKYFLPNINHQQKSFSSLSFLNSSNSNISDSSNFNNPSELHVLHTSAKTEENVNLNLKPKKSSILRSDKTQHLNLNKNIDQINKNRNTNKVSFKVDK